MGLAEIGSAGSGLGIGVASSIGSISRTGGGLGRFGEVMSAPVSLPISEGLAPASFLENTMPLTLNDIHFDKGGERFDLGIGLKTPEPGLNVEDALFEVESILLRASPQPENTEIPTIFQSGLEDINLNPNIKDDVAKLDVFGSLPTDVILSGRRDLTSLRAKNLSRMRVPNESGDPSLIVQDDKTVWQEPVFVPIPQRVITPFLEPVTKAAIAIRLGTQSQTQTRVEEHQSEASQPLVKVVEELVEEEVLVKDRSDERTEDEEKEQSQEVRLRRIVDEEAVKVRIGEIIEAAKKVDNGGEIDGVKIVENLPGQHAKNRSGELNIIDPKGKLFDGSLLATITKIASEKFSSLLEVFKKATEIVKEDVPVTRGEGKGVTDEDVAKVYKDHKGKVPPALEVIKRVIKMKKIVKIQPQSSGYNQAVEIEKKEENEGEGNIWENQDLAQALKAG